MVKVIFFIFSRSRDLDHVTLLFSEKVENIGKFISKNEVKEG